MTPWTAILALALAHAAPSTPATTAGPPGTENYAALARCQMACDADAVDASRASCKLTCLKTFPAVAPRPATQPKRDAKRGPQPRTRDAKATTRTPTPTAR